MTPTYEIFVKLYEEARLLPGASSFVETFAGSGRENAGMFSFADKETARQALALASRQQLESQLYYFFHIDPKEIAARLGFYFAIDVEEYILESNQVQSRFLANVDTAIDLHTDSLLVTERLKDLLSEQTRGLKFVSVATATEDRWFQIAEISALPQPILVPMAMYFKPNESPPGTYAVQSDGRDVLTKVNIDWLQQNGIGVSREVTVSTKRVPWRPRVLISGKLMARLQQTGIKGLAMPPTPLLTQAEADDVELIASA